MPLIDISQKQNHTRYREAYRHVPYQMKLDQSCCGQDLTIGDWLVRRQAARLKLRKRLSVRIPDLLILMQYPTGVRQQRAQGRTETDRRGFGSSATDTTE